MNLTLLGSVSSKRPAPFSVSQNHDPESLPCSKMSSMFYPRAAPTTPQFPQQRLLPLFTRQPCVVSTVHCFQTLTKRDAVPPCLDLSAPETCVVKNCLKKSTVICENWVLVRKQMHGVLVRQLMVGCPMTGTTVAKLC